MNVSLKLVEDITDLCNKWDCIRTRLRDARYKARGIGICEEWLGAAGRKRFILWGLGAGYTRGLELDRINNEKGYSPTNCRWATRSQQMRNTANSVFVHYLGKRYNLKELSEHKDCKVNYGVFKARISIGWNIKRAMTQPVRGT